MLFAVIMQHRLEDIIMNRRTLLISLFVTPILLSATVAFAGRAAVFTGLINGTGAGGYDVVAYQVENAAKPGNEAVVAEFEGVKYRFISEANRATFTADPAKYIPAYGGYCAYAVSKGSTASTDPEAFTVVDGKLYLNYSKGVQSKWQEDVSGNITAANGNWPKVLGN
jgi:YHS domain-containing protein